MKNYRVRLSHFIIYIVVILMLPLAACSLENYDSGENVQNNGIDTLSDDQNKTTDYDIDGIPEFEDEPYAVLNANIPEFTEEDYTTEPFEEYSREDSLGRCGTAFANVCEEIMPDTERDDIGMIKPSGWHTVKYDCVDGKYLYNRCHLIGYQLTGENDNERNLITGTRYMNVQGMLPFEDMVDDYIEDTGNHVLYRVTPVYEGDNLVADGVQMEGWSVEDNGEGICYNVFVYNVQPGIDIDYSTGDSRLSDDSTAEYAGTDDGAVSEPGDSAETEEVHEYVLNTNTMKFHTYNCSSAAQVSDKNKEISYKSRKELIEDGYTPCGRCRP